MSGAPSWPGPRSGAPAYTEPPAPGPADALELGGVLGVGGMGEVRTAWDPSLEREVAVKIPRQHADAEDARLMAEARLTARLEHPGIVPVYRLGRTEDGRTCYSMRLLRGRSLAAALAEAGTTEARLALAPHLLAVAQAVAYAHDQGVLHRDLKPSNVLIGLFGETLVTDWGLAVDHGPGGGTPGYASPEQTAGEPLDGRTDVHALGVMLAEIAGPDGPPELLAIARRACAPSRDDRYPDMVALAGDLSAWFAGRRVAAYDYRPTELLARLLRAWRGPLTVAMLATVLLVIAVGVGWLRTSRERDRAVRAEVDANAARAEAVEHLAQALVSQSQRAAADDRRAEAERLAARALLLSESPDARGVLARFAGAPRPTRLSRQALPPCDRLMLSADGRRLACVQPDAVLLLDAASPATPLARWPQRAMHAAPNADGTALALLDEAWRPWSWTPPAAPIPAPALGEGTPALLPGSGERVAWQVGDGVGEIDPRSGLSWRRTPCGADLHVAAPTADGLVVACGGGRLMQVHQEGEDELTPPLPLDSVPTAVAQGHGHLAVGGARGEVALRTRDGRTLRLRLQGRIDRIELSAAVAAARTEQGELLLVDLVSGLEIARLQVGRHALAWEDARTLVLAGAQVERLAVGPAPEPTRVSTGEGVSALALPGDRVAAGLGDGTLVVLGRQGVERRLRLGERAIKDLLVDGDRLVAAVAAQEVAPVVDLQTWQPRGALPTGGLRRLVSLAGDPLALPYGGGLWWRGALIPAASGSYWAAAAVGERAVVVDQQDLLWELRPPALRRLAGPPQVYTLAAREDDTLVGVRDAIVVLDREGVERARWPVTGQPHCMALSHDGAWVATGMVEGPLFVHRRDGALRARLIGHEGRVSAVAFSEDDRWIVSGSWDASVRWWSTAALEIDPSALAAIVETWEGSAPIGPGYPSPASGW